MNQEQSIYEQITGTIIVSREETETGPVITAEWKGGDVIGMSGELLRNADPQYLELDGRGGLRIHQFMREIIAYDEQHDLYLCRRLATDVSC